MSSEAKPTYQQLQERLAVAEPIVEALKHHEVDAVVGQDKIAFLLLREVTDALLASEAGFRAMFDLSGVGMFQADSPAFQFTRVNKRFCDKTGYSAEELLTKTYLGLTHPQDRRRDMNALSPVLRDRADSWSIEKRCIRKDGSVVWISVHGAAVRDDAGGVVRIMAMVRDIMDRKQAEKEHREQAATIGKLTAELARFKNSHVRKPPASAGSKASHKRRLGNR
jgi:PAS domain S-box-containing protein